MQAMQRQQEMRKNLLIYLPEDLFINNILLSKVLPIKSLLILRCVCKYLRNLLTSPAFIKLHLHHLHHSTTSPPNHQLNNQLVLIDSDTPYDVLYSLKFNDGDDPCRPEVIMLDYPIKSSEIWGSCNGLLCLSTSTTKADDDDDDRVCLWNPLTKEYKDLPPPLPSTEIINIPIRTTAKILNYGFGYDSFIDDYKVIRWQGYEHLYDDDKIYGNQISNTEIQVYTLGTNTWKNISSTPADNNHLMLPFLPAAHTYLNGALHWVMSTSKMTEVKIASFDIEKEVFREMQTPSISGKDYSCTSLRGCLCALEFDWKENCCNVWMMMDYGVKESWTKLFTIIQKEVDMRPYYSNLLRFFENGEILIISDDILFIYDPTNNKARPVEFGENGKYFLNQSEIYIESLVSLNSGVYIESELIRAFGCINLD